MSTTLPAELKHDFGVVTGTACERRLSDDTRTLAARYLAGEIGTGMVKPAWSESGADVPQELRESWAAGIVERIAAEAPLRIIPGERLMGAATLLGAPSHQLPGTDHRSVSHTTLDFEGVLQCGYAGLRTRIDERLAASGIDDTARSLLLAMRRCIDAALLWNRRHIEALEALLPTSSGEERRRYEEALLNLRRVPEHPPRSFKEGIQALWSLWDFHRLCGNWSGIGRIDKMLGPLLEADLAAGRIELDEARDWVAHFWCKGCEWIQPCGDGFRPGSGDAQTYQNIVLAGVDEDGHEVCNALTHLVLDVVEELHISDFPIAVRINRASPPALLERIAAVQQRGGGIVAIYNEELVIEALCDFGYELRDARNFANDGCWEAIIPGRTAFAYNSYDVLRLLQQALGVDDGQPLQADCFEDVYAAFKQRLDTHVGYMHDIHDDYCTDAHAVPLVSLFCRGCIERGRGYYDRGADFTVRAIHAGGIPDCANSLAAIRQLVFEQQRLSLAELVGHLRANWRDAEELRAGLTRELRFYGNDEPETDAILQRVFNDHCSAVARHRERAGVLRPAGVSTFGRELSYAERRAATAFGAHAGDVLATNMAATPGTDSAGPTALMRSFCSCDLRRAPNGVPLELKLDTASATGERGRAVLVAMMKTYVALGGFFLHIDVVDSELLKDAQRHPERYPNLAVRISGWSARFATLDERWQNMIINRSQQRVR